MRIFSRIRELNMLQLWRLSWVGVQNPLMVWPTFRATKRTMEICNKLFGEHHHKNNSNNAFRHALWNILICKYAFQVSKNNEKAIVWAKKITSMHENLVPNKALEEAMDLHNNELGRIYFRQFGNASEEEIVSFLEFKMDEAAKVAKIAEIQDFTDKLVYME